MGRIKLDRQHMNIVKKASNESEYNKRLSTRGSSGHYHAWIDDNWLPCQISKEEEEVQYLITFTEDSGRYRTKIGISLSSLISNIPGGSLGNIVINEIHDPISFKDLKKKFKVDHILSYGSISKYVEYFTDWNKPTTIKKFETLKLFLDMDFDKQRYDHFIENVVNTNGKFKPPKPKGYDQLVVGDTYMIKGFDSTRPIIGEFIGTIDDECICIKTIRINRLFPATYSEASLHPSFFNIQERNYLFSGIKEIIHIKEIDERILEALCGEEIDFELISNDQLDCSLDMFKRKLYFELDTRYIIFSIHEMWIGVGDAVVITATQYTKDSKGIPSLSVVNEKLFVTY